jgi:hypothetical protein
VPEVETAAMADRRGVIRLPEPPVDRLEALADPEERIPEQQASCVGRSMMVRARGTTKQSRQPMLPASPQAPPSEPRPSATWLAPAFVPAPDTDERLQATIAELLTHEGSERASNKANAVAATTAAASVGGGRDGADRDGAPR